MNKGGSLTTAWESRYLAGTSQDDPLKDAMVAAKNPYTNRNGLDTPAKKSVQTAEETP